MKKLRYLMEAGLLWLAFSIFQVLPVDTASDLGGWIGRTIGPRLAASRKALKNLQAAMPEADHAKIIVDMWDNLGRVIAEYPHLIEIIMTRMEIINEDHLQMVGKDKPCIIIGAHLANWELFPFYLNHKVNWPITGVYRAPNNPYVEKLLEKCRHPTATSGNYIPKSTGGTREILKVLKNGGRVGLLIDQKNNQGIPVKFFGRLAMTSPAFAQLARKYDCPILPLHLVRTKGCHFTLTIHPPFKVEEDDRDEEVVLEAHKMLEDCIRKNPGQWLWLHRRWDSGSLNA